ncbi:MAG: alpha-L-fucosidase [Phycisphaerae bacterium]
MSFDPYQQQVEIAEASKADGVKVLPTEAQKAWMDLKFGMFIHFGINTFHDAEWSDGTYDPATFDPVDFDAEQWVAAAKSAGINYLLLVTKHHDGFCLWPSRWTEYSVSASPGKIDVVGAVAQACQKHGLKLGLYYSLWDRNYPGYDNDHAYAIYMKRHLAELLTQYGPICEVWFDGGWKKGGVDWQDDRRWHWLEIYEHIKTIQPDCLVGNNGTTQRNGQIVMYPCDFRIFEKALPAEDERKIYYCGGIGDWLPGESCHTLSAGGKGGMFPTGKWFWHADDDTVHEPEWVIEWLDSANARGANFVLNAGPSDRGLLRDCDVACLQQVGKLRGTG